MFPADGRVEINTIVNASADAPAAFLLELFETGVAAAAPDRCLAANWPAPAGPLTVIACGKAAGGMALAAREHYGEAATGIVIAPANGPSVLQVPGFRSLAASHPVPDRRSVAAAAAALELASGLQRDDLLLILVSGGASSLMCKPAPGVSLRAKQHVSRRLLDCGATIAEINCVRKHLSGIKGGRLAAATRATVVTLAISDVPGDDPALIGSGPTVEDQSSLADARSVVRRYRLAAPPAVHAALSEPANESPRFGHARGNDRLTIVASGQTALQAAAERCLRHGVPARVLGDELQGEATVLAREHARLARALADRGERCCLLSGGETTVTLTGTGGNGGRNSEYALALAVELDGDERIWALAADTDGIDGCGGHAGAIVGPGTLQRGQAAGFDPGACLRNHDSAGFLEGAGGLLPGGGTGTNVNDFRAILVRP